MYNGTTAVHIHSRIEFGGIHKQWEQELTISASEKVIKVRIRKLHFPGNVIPHVMKEKGEKNKFAIESLFRALFALIYFWLKMLECVACLMLFAWSVAAL